MLDHESQLRFFSYGIVTKDKARGDVAIEATPTEVRFTTQDLMDGEHTPENIEHYIRGGKDYVNISIGGSIPATYIDFNSNRITPPDVKKDELVFLWRLGSTDIFFWQDRNVSNVKRLETVVYAFSADPDMPVKDDLSNAYYLMLSTHDKHITLKTSKSNGEFCRFTHQINTADGIIITEDDIGNSQWFDSKNTDIGWLNAHGTKFHMSKKLIYGFAKDSIKFKSKFIGFECTSFDIKCNSYNAVADSSYTVKCGTYNCTSDSYTTKSKTWSNTTDAASITAPMISLNGSVAIGGAARGRSGATCVITADSMDFTVKSFIVNAPTIKFNGAIVAGDITCSSIKGDGSGLTGIVHP